MAGDTLHLWHRKPNYRRPKESLQGRNQEAERKFPVLFGDPRRLFRTKFHYSWQKGFIRRQRFIGPGVSKKLGQNWIQVGLDG